MPPRARVTTRLRTQCGAGIATRFSCVQAGADYDGVSWPIAHAAFIAHVDPLRAAPLPPEERRAAIIEAVLPLLMEQGASD